MQAENRPQAVDEHMEVETDTSALDDSRSGLPAEEAPAAEEHAMHVEVEGDQPLDELVADLATNQAPAPLAAASDKPKRWYIIHAYTGFEKKVAQAIRETAAQQGLSEAFEEVVVPTEEVVEMRRGKKIAAERKFFPGYVLVKMEMNDATWQLVRQTDKVAGFLGGGGTRPQPITEREAQAIFQQVQEGIDAPKRAVNFDIGEQVKVVDGPFESFVGIVEDIDEDKEKLKVSVSIFGRPTPVELDFNQVDKI